MLEEYKEIYRAAADVIPGWREQSKNDLCRAYVLHKGDETLQNAYYGAIMYRYWGLIPKYYYMSANCATVEECYGWLVDSVSCCLDLASWEDPTSSIYKDPNGPDKVINRCMKCARLTYYQFINRKKRRDNFGLLSIDELRELFGNGVDEPYDTDEETKSSSFVIKEYILQMFNKKDYFVSFLVDCIVTSNVFDTLKDDQDQMFFEFNIRKLVKIMTNLDEDYIDFFSTTYGVPYLDVQKAFTYVKAVSPTNMRKKIITTLEQLKHSEFILALLGG